MSERLSRQWDAGEGTPSGPLFEAGFCFAWKTADNATSTPAGHESLRRDHSRPRSKHCVQEHGLTRVRCMTVCQASASVAPDFMLATGGPEIGQLARREAGSTIA